MAREQAQGRAIPAICRPSVALAAVFAFAFLLLPSAEAMSPALFLFQPADSQAVDLIRLTAFHGDPTDIEFGRRGDHQDGDPTDIEGRDPQAPEMDDALVVAVSTWPNPSHGLTAVCFALPSAMDVRVGIYDAAGRRVATIAAGLTAAGPHQIMWRGADDSGQPLATGVYFARLAAGRASSVSRLLLIR